MRLLLTRALEDAARTQGKLEAAGHRVLLSPLLTIAATGAPWPSGVVDALVATSGHAFSALADGPTLEARRLMPLLLVGSRTESNARACGFLGGSAVASNASALAQMIEETSHKPKRAVYLAGRDRKPDAEAALQMAGWTVETVETYEAHAATYLEPRISDAIRAGRADGVLHFSARSAALFAALAQKSHLAIDGLRHFCLSDDVGEPLRKAGCARLTIAEAPNEAALLAIVANAEAVQA